MVATRARGHRPTRSRCRRDLQADMPVVPRCGLVRSVPGSDRFSPFVTVSATCAIPHTDARSRLVSGIYLVVVHVRIPRGGTPGSRSAERVSFFLSFVLSGGPCGRSRRRSGLRFPLGRRRDFFWLCGIRQEVLVETLGAAQSRLRRWRRISQAALGTCCVMQWMFPPPSRISRAEMPTSWCSGKHPPSTAAACSS